MNQTIELLLSHRSIRKFTTRPIAAETLELLVRAGQAASTSNHVQACTLIRVTNPTRRQQLAQLAGGQAAVENCAEFLVVCADMKRPMAAAAAAGAEVIAGMTEHLLVATVDSALLAQNLVVAAESLGLGACYIGGIRSNIAEVAELLQLPDQVYPVFGLCLGYPDQDTDVKPRLPVALVMKQEVYNDREDEAQIAAFDQTMSEYYQARSGNNKSSNWSQQLKPLFTTKLRAHMKDFLNRRGFGLK